MDSRCVSSHFKEWKYFDKDHQNNREQIYKEKVEKRQEINKLKTFENRKPVIIIDGVYYYSFKDAGEEYGIYWESVQNRGVSENFKNWTFPNKEDFEKYSIKFKKISERKNKKYKNNTQSLEKRIRY